VPEHYLVLVYQPMMLVTWTVWAITILCGGAIQLYGVYVTDCAVGYGLR